jgi:hypothetical protein
MPIAHTPTTSPNILSSILICALERTPRLVSLRCWVHPLPLSVYRMDGHHDWGLGKDLAALCM